MNKHKILATLILLALFATAVNSCKKSSANSKALVGTWEAITVKSGQQDVTSTWTQAPYTETYKSDGSYSFTGQPKGNNQYDNGSGKYTWNGDTAFKRNGLSNQSSVTCDIFSFDPPMIVYTYVDGGIKWEFTLMKK